MPTDAHDLQHGDQVYLIRDGERVFAVRAALVEVGEIHHAGVREEALKALGDKEVATRQVADAEPEVRAHAQKAFVASLA